MRYLLYAFTLALHWTIAVTFMNLTGNIGIALVVVHWWFFGGYCSLSHVERFVHIKLTGDSWIKENWRGCIAYDLFSKIHPIFR